MKGSAMPPHLQKPLFALSFGFALWILATQNAMSQSAPPAQAAQCAPRAAVLSALADKYNEARRGIGMAGSVVVMELFSNAETGTWTIIATRPDGISCLVASGTEFEAVNDPAPAKGAPA